MKSTIFNIFLCNYNFSCNMMNTLCHELLRINANWDFTRMLLWFNIFVLFYSSQQWFLMIWYDIWSLNLIVIPFGSGKYYRISIWDYIYVWQVGQPAWWLYRKERKHSHFSIPLLYIITLNSHLFIYLTYVQYIHEKIWTSSSNMQNRSIPPFFSHINSINTSTES